MTYQDWHPELINELVKSGKLLNAASEGYGPYLDKKIPFTRFDCALHEFMSSHYFEHEGPAQTEFHILSVAGRLGRNVKTLREKMPNHFLIHSPLSMVLVDGVNFDLSIPRCDWEQVQTAFILKFHFVALFKA